MKNKYIKMFMVATIFLVGPSCDSKLDLQPAQSLSTSESLSDFSGVSAALVGAYDGLQSVNYYGRNYVISAEVRGDNVYVSSANSNRFVQDYQYSLTPDINTLGTFWNQAYSVILRVNNIINSANNVTDALPGQLEQVVAEAKAIRALVYFDLLRVYSLPYSEKTGDQDGVPLILEAQIGEPARDTQDAVYTQILMDLTESKGMFTNETISPYRFNVNSVNALLARVHLYMGENDLAAERATDVINVASYQLEDDLGSLWNTTGSSEEIFTLRRLANETLGSDNLGSIYNPAPNGYGDIRVTQDIVDLYEAGDERAEYFYEFTAQGRTENYVSKFTGESGIPGLTSPKILRLAEMYLIRAEARAKTGNTNGALNDINILRGRADIADLAVPAAEVLEAVLLERRLELAFEGHRSFDLWRNGQPLQRIQCNTGVEVNAPTGCLVEENSGLRAYPIPNSEINANVNIKQNEAYQ